MNRREPYLHGRMDGLDYLVAGGGGKRASTSRPPIAIAWDPEQRRD